MTTDQIINGLNYEIGMILFNPSTGESKEPEQLNVLDRASYEVCLAAIEALSAQVPRVLKLEEVHSLEQNEVVWLEDNGVEEIIPAIVVEHGHTYAQRSVCFMIVENPRLWIATFDYLNRWRCWTSRPTEEEREAAEWDE